MITVEEFGYEHADTALMLVDKLLEELREEDESVELDKKKILDDWQRFQDRFTFFVALDENNNSLGIITLAENFAIYADGACGVINELYVAPGQRGQSVGKMLIETAKEYGKFKGWHRIDVTCPPGEKWQRTVNFYMREGFTVSGPRLKFKL
jgi:GNAT superfamily N-acetyltransferase